MLIERQNGYGLARQNLRGWVIVALLLTLTLVVDIFNRPLEIESWQLLARYTARLSFMFFLLSYLASPLYALSANQAFDWLRRNRRNAGISFSIIHTVHFVALICFFIVTGEEVPPSTIIVGGGAYLAMFAMLATSDDNAIRRVGAKRWRLIHKFGAHYLAFIFLFVYTAAYFESNPEDWNPMPLVIMIWAAITVRLWVMFASVALPKKAILP